MQKKAQGLSLNFIIVALIVVLVGIVIVGIFTGFFGGRVVPGLVSCEANGGECFDTSTQACQNQITSSEVTSFNNKFNEPCKIALDNVDTARCCISPDKVVAK